MSDMSILYAATLKVLDNVRGLLHNSAYWGGPYSGFELGIPVRFDNATSPYPSGVQRPIRWRVVSCQNLVDGGCMKKDATDQDRVYRYGEIKQFD